MRTRATHRRGRTGSTLIWLAVCLTAIAGVLALGMDGGRMMEERRRAQASADAAALAGAKALADADAQKKAGSQTAATAAAEAAAQSAAAANGYAAAAVTVNTPPTAGTFKGKSKYVEVFVQTGLKGTFSRLLTQSDLTVRARAVARYGHTRLGIQLLQESGTALKVSGNADVTVNGGSIQVNSDGSQSLAMSGNGTLTADDYQLVGGYTGSNIQGPITTGVAPADDPLAGLPAPDLSILSARVWAGQPVLQPGLYPGGLHFSGQTAVTLLPGVYVLQGGGLSLSGQASLVGVGVTIYNTGPNAGPIDLSGQGAVQLTAPTSGPYAGIALFQDRAVSQEVQITGNGSLQITGVLYAPAAPVKLSGNGAADNTSLGAIVANSLTVSGNGSITVNAADDLPGSTDLRLVE